MSKNEAIETLKNKLVAGEISFDEYTKQRAVLLGVSMNNPEPKNQEEEKKSIVNDDDEKQAVVEAAIQTETLSVPKDDSVNAVADIPKNRNIKLGIIIGVLLAVILSVGYSWMNRETPEEHEARVAAAKEKARIQDSLNRENAIVTEDLFTNTDTDESQMNNDYFDVHEVANLLSFIDFVDSKTADKALEFAGVGAKSYFLTPATHNSKGGDFDYSYSDETYTQELVYHADDRYVGTLFKSDYSTDYEDAFEKSKMMVEETADAREDNSEAAPAYAFPKVEYAETPYGPSSVESIVFTVRCDGPMAETESKSVKVKRSAVSDMDNNEINIYLRKKQNEVIAKLGYLKPTSANVTRMELNYNLANRGSGKAYFLARVLGEKMIKLSGSNSEDVEVYEDEENRQYTLTIRNETFKEFRLRCTDSRIAIVLKFRMSINSKEFKGDNIHGRYPEASIRKLTASDLKYLSKEELRIMRNEIFARYGRIFVTEDMNKYFSSQSWYKPRFEKVSDKLTEIENHNVKLIRQYE